MNECGKCGQLIPKDSLCGRLNFLRVRKGKTMRKLAEETHVSVSTISRAESGRDLSVENLKRLADYFNVSLDYLVYGEVVT